MEINNIISLLKYVLLNVKTKFSSYVDSWEAFSEKGFVFGVGSFPGGHRRYEKYLQNQCWLIKIYYYPGEDNGYIRSME